MASLTIWHLIERRQRMAEWFRANDMATFRPPPDLRGFSPPPTRDDKHALPADLVPEIMAATLVEEVVALAQTLGIDAACAVIAQPIKAATASDRSAARIFRAVLGKAPPDQVVAAIKAIGP
jgi:hypothetical protein